MWYPGTHFGVCMVCGTQCRLDVVTDPDGMVHTQWTDKLRVGDSVVTAQEKLRRAQEARDERERSEAMAREKLANGNISYGSTEYEPVHKRIARTYAKEDYFTMAAEPRVWQLGDTGKWYVTVCLEFLRGEGDRERVYTFYGTEPIDLKEDSGMEKAETGAVGRALAFAGYCGDAGIATQEDMERVERRAGKAPEREYREGYSVAPPVHKLVNVQNTAATAEPARPAPKSQETVKEALVQLDLTGVRKLIKREIETGRAKHEPAGTVLSETQRASLPQYAKWCGWADGEYAVLWQQSTGKTAKQFEQGATHSDWLKTVPVAVGA